MHWKISSGERATGRTGAYLALSFMSFLLILSWWSLWTQWYKCGLTSQQKAIKQGPGCLLRLLHLFFPLETFPLWLWHHADTLVCPASCPFLTHSTYSLQSTFRESYRKLIFTTKTEKRKCCWSPIVLLNILMCESQNPGDIQWWDGFGIGLSSEWKLTCMKRHKAESWQNIRISVILLS